MGDFVSESAAYWADTFLCKWDLVAYNHIHCMEARNALKNSRKKNKINQNQLTTSETMHITL